MSVTSARLAIRHVTGYVYDGFAESSYNEARMTPLSSPRQLVLETSLRTSPDAWQLTYLDYFGSAVTSFDLHERHAQLEVVAEALVEVRTLESSGASLTIAELSSPAIVDRYSEYLLARARTELPLEIHRDLASYVEGFRLEEVVAATSEYVRCMVAYVSGSTHVTTTAYESWTQGSGVCQDISHLMIALLRGRGIPARYVSGYLHPNAEAALGERVSGQSHAWVEYFNGEWVGVDPTNGEDIGLQHVVVAKGRDYGDVPPLKGIYHGAPSRALGVSVEITRVA